MKHIDTLAQEVRVSADNSNVQVEPSVILWTDKQRWETIVMIRVHVMRRANRGDPIEWAWARCVRSARCLTSG